jgi:hypothetical protein
MKTRHFAQVPARSAALPAKHHEQRVLVTSHQEVGGDDLCSVTRCPCESIKMNIGLSADLVSQKKGQLVLKLLRVMDPETLSELRFVHGPCLSFDGIEQSTGKEEVCSLVTRVP